MANTLSTFNFGAHPVRIVMRGEEPWFVCTDVAEALGYRNAPDASRHLDADEKGTHNLRTLGGEQKATIINESGLYALVLRSRKPEARKFAKWVTGEVLPSIRKTGRYSVQQQLALDPKRAGFYKALEASNALSSAVQIAAMQALMEGGELKAGRWVMNINEHEGFGQGVHVKPMPLNAIMAAPEDWPRLIAEPNGNYFSKETLTLIMNACLNKLLDYLDCTQQANEMLREELRRRKALPA